MVDPDVVNVPGVLELLKGGANAGVIGLVIIAVSVAKRFLAELAKIAVAISDSSKANIDAIRESTKANTENHAENLAEFEAIKRAIIARDPGKAQFFEKS